MNKLIRSKKALSPVIASIILIAVTVAVAVAVSAWMGSMAVGEMEVSELTITHLDFTPGDAEDGRILINLANSGTSDVTVYRIRINGENVDTWESTTSNTVLAGTPETFTVTKAVTASTKYSVMLFSIDGTMVGSYTATA